MATTTHGLPYPLGTDPISSGDDVIKALAQALDPAVRTGPLTAGVGWAQATDVRLFRLGPLCIVHFRVNRTGTDVVSPASGNVGDNQMAGGLPSDMVPALTLYGVTVQSSANFGGGRVVGTDGGASAGQVVITTLMPNSTIPTGTSVDVDCTYMLW